MSQTISAVLIQLAVIFLPMLGVNLGTDQLTVTVQTVAVILAGIWIWVRRIQSGGVNIFGIRI